MRLVVDTSVLVGELLRISGRTRLGDERLELYLPEQMWGETRVELPRRISAFIRRRSLEPNLGDELTAACLAAIEANIVILDEGIYAALEDEARERSVRDPRGWPVVAGRPCAERCDLDQRQRLPRHWCRHLDRRHAARLAPTPAGAMKPLRRWRRPRSASRALSA